MHKRIVASSTAAAALAAALVSAAPAPAAPALVAGPIGTQMSTYSIMTPARVLDTRSSGGAIGARATRTVQVTGRAGVPSTGVTAVVLNVTSISPSTATYLSVYPAGGTRPTVSSLNVRAGETRANLVTVPVSSAGQIAIFNASGSTNVAVDAVGFYRPDTITGGASYLPTEPTRVFDSRLQPNGAIPPYWVDSYSLGPTPASVKAVSINLTAVKPASSGYLTAYNGAGDPPPVSTLNFTPGATVPNMAVVPVLHLPDGTGEIAVANASTTSSVNVIIDITGVYSTDTTKTPYKFRPVTPTRVVDTRSANAPIGPNQTRTVPVASTAITANTVSLVGNATAITPTASTYLTMWSGASTRPTASGLNASAGQTVANSSWPGLAGTTTRTFATYNNAGSTHFAFDVMGVFVNPARAAYSASGTTSAPTFTAPTLTRVRRTPIAR